MEPVTIQGPVVILPANEYQTIVSRLNQLDHEIRHLVQRMEDLEDIEAIREVEAAHRAGAGVAFSALLAEIQTETD